MAAASCSSAAVVTVTNYVASGVTYGSSPAGLTVGAGGVVSGGTDGASYTITATSTSAGSCPSTASSSFTNDTDSQLADSDGDGVCDINDICPGFDDNVDTDNDSIPNGCDPDDDNDGNPDSTDPNPATPTTTADTVSSTPGVLVTVDVLANDDYLDNNDPNNAGTTTLVDAGTGTAAGTISFDPSTGELDYTPTAGEAGTSVTVIYTVCNTDPTSRCM